MVDENISVEPLRPLSLINSPPAAKRLATSPEILIVAHLSEDSVNYELFVLN